MKGYIIISLQVVWFIGYLTFITTKFGILDSISESYYKLKERGYYFTIFMSGLGIPMFFYETGFAFFTGAFLFVTGLAAEYKEDITSTVHGIGATGAITIASFGLLFDGIAFPIICVFVSAFLLAIINPNKKTMIAEVLAFIIIQLGYLHSIGGI